MSRPVLLALAVLLLACGDEPTTTATNSGVARPNTRVLSAEGRAAFESFGADGRLVFAETDETAAFEVGQILASEPATVAPYGLLRRVTGASLEGGKVVVETVPAELYEALQEAEAHFEGTVDASSVDVFRPNALWIDLPFEYIVWDEDGQHDTTQDQLRVNAHFLLSAGFGIDYSLFDADALFDDLNPFDAVDLSVSVMLGLEQTASASVTIPLTLPDLAIRKNVHESWFDPITFFIGPVPVVLVPKLSIDVAFAAGIAAGGQTYGASQALHASVGFSCNDDGCSSTGGDLGPEFSSDLPTFEDFAAGYVKLDLIPRLDVLVYGLGGPFLEGEAGVRLNVMPLQAPAWDIIGSLVGRIGLGAFGWDWSTDFFNKSWTLLEGENVAPKLDLSAPATVIEGAAVHITATAFDLEQGALPVTLSDSAGAFPPTSVAPGETFERVLPFGDHVITAVVTDADGLAASDEVTVRVVNPPPDVHLFAPTAGAVFFAGLPVSLRATAIDGFVTQNGVIPCDQITWSGGLVGDSVPADNCGANADGVIKATFASPGARTLQVQADDGRSLDVATVTFEILPAPPGAIQVQLSPKLEGEVYASDDAVLVLAFEASIALGDTAQTGVSYHWQVATCVEPLVGCGADVTTVSGVFDVSSGPSTFVEDAWTMAAHLGAPPCGNSQVSRVQLVVDGELRATFVLRRAKIC